MQLKYLFLGLLAMILLLPAAVHAQSPMPTGIAGSLTDGKQPLAGATITVLETKKSAISGSKGEFSLPLPPGSYTIEIHYVGLKTITRKITVGPSQVIHLPVTMSVESK